MPRCSTGVPGLLVRRGPQADHHRSRARCAYRDHRQLPYPEKAFILVTAHVTALRPLPDLLREHARRLGTKTAFQDGRCGVTYGELELRTGRLAGHLVGLGLRHGARVAILLGSRVEAVESVLAVVRAGAVGVPMDPRSTTSELAHLLDDSGALVVFTDRSSLGQLLPLLPERPRLSVVLVQDAATRGGSPAAGASGGPADEAGMFRYESLAATEPPGRLRTTSGSTRWPGSSTPPGRPAGPRGCCPPSATGCLRWRPASSPSSA